MRADYHGTDATVPPTPQPQPLCARVKKFYQQSAGQRARVRVPKSISLCGRWCNLRTVRFSEHASLKTVHTLQTTRLHLRVHTCTSFQFLFFLYYLSSGTG